MAGKSSIGGRSDEPSRGRTDYERKVMRTCKHCGEKFPDDEKEHDCAKAGRRIRQDDDDDFASSFLLGMATGIPFFGRNIAAGLLGMAIHNSSSAAAPDVPPPAPTPTSDPVETTQPWTPPAPETTYERYEPAPAASWHGPSSSDDGGNSYSPSSDSGSGSSSSYDSGSSSSDSGGSSGGGGE